MAYYMIYLSRFQFSIENCWMTSRTFSETREFFTALPMANNVLIYVYQIYPDFFLLFSGL